MPKLLVDVVASEIASDRGFEPYAGEILGDVRPAFMLQIVTQLIKPEVLVEVEIIAAAK